MKKTITITDPKGYILTRPDEFNKVLNALMSVCAEAAQLHRQVVVTIEFNDYSGKEKRK